MIVRFADPFSGNTITADADPTLTAEAAVRDLIEGGVFPPAIEGGEYLLVSSRTKRTLKPRESFGAAGIEDGDVIEVVATAQGARS